MMDIQEVKLVGTPTFESVAAIRRWLHGSQVSHRSARHAQGPCIGIGTHLILVSRSVLLGTCGSVEVRKARPGCLNDDRLALE